MSIDDIETIVHAFSAAAARMHAADFDGLEVHLGHGHLLQQFLSPVVNQRTDQYGADARGRLRFTQEVLRAVAGAVPAGFPVGVRISADEFLAGGLDPDAMVEVIAALLDEMPLAYLHVSHSAYVGQASLSTQIADMSFGAAPFRHLPRRFRAEFPEVPVIAVCRIDDVEVASDIIQSGDADLVAMARPLIADPELVLKARTGRRDETRSCLACNQACIGRIEMNLPLSCVVNPSAGTERQSLQMQERAATTVRIGPRPPEVLVVGGGPAGLQGALTARRAGCQVKLIEARPALGGQVSLAATVPGRERLLRLVAELERDCRAAGVEIVLGATVDQQSPELMAADLVLVATGAEARIHDVRGPVPVIDIDTACRRLASAQGLPDVVAVLDEEGSWAAASVADALARQRRRVHLVSPTAQVAQRITTYSRVGLVAGWADLDMRVAPLRRAVRSLPTGLVLADTITGREEMLESVGLVISVPARAARGQLHGATVAARPRYGAHLIGDALAPRGLVEATFEAHATVQAALAAGPTTSHEGDHHATNR